MQITRDYVKAYFERYGQKEQEYQDKIKHLEVLKEQLHSFERHNTEVKSSNSQSKQDRLIPLIMDLEKELKEDRSKIDKMFIEREKLIRKSSPCYAFILFGKYLNFRSLQELADQYGKSKSYAQNRLSKGIDELTEILKNNQAKKVR